MYHLNWSNSLEWHSVSRRHTRLCYLQSFCSRLSMFFYYIMINVAVTAFREDHLGTTLKRVVKRSHAFTKAENVLWVPWASNTFCSLQRYSKNNLVTKNGFCGLFDIISSDVSSSKCENVPLWFTKRSGKPASLSVCIFFRHHSSTENERLKQFIKIIREKEREEVMTFPIQLTINCELQFAGFRAGSLRHRDRNQLDSTCFGFPLSFFSYRLGHFTWIRWFSILKSSSRDSWAVVTLLH